MLDYKILLLDGIGLLAFILIFLVAIKVISNFKKGLKEKSESLFKFLYQFVLILVNIQLPSFCKENIG